MILQRPIIKFHPNFPKRGYRAEELLQTLMQILDDHNAYLILTMDELEFLIRTEGSDPLYNLSRVQEDRITAPQRLSLICILREPKHLEALDPSTRSTLQRNAISLEEYSQPQLQDILKDRVALSFRCGTVSEEILSFIAELAVAEEGDARYALDLLWRAGKYADASGSPEVFPEAVRKAAVSVYPVVRKDLISTLDLHQKLLVLAIARRFKQTGLVYISMGEAENAYSVVCEEYGEKQRGHTQLWKYLQEISALGVIGTKLSGVGQRGKTTLISLPRVPAYDLENELSKILYSKNGR